MRSKRSSCAGRPDAAALVARERLVEALPTGSAAALGADAAGTSGNDAAEGLRARPTGALRAGPDAPRAGGDAERFFGEPDTLPGEEADDDRLDGMERSLTDQAIIR